MFRSEHHLRRSQAQALVEFAVILPVLLLMTLGMIDLGRSFTFGIGVQQGARESARLGSRYAISAGGVSDATVLQRLIDASSPALWNCQAVQTLQTCAGGTWTFTLAVKPNGSATTYSSMATAAANSTTLSGGQVTVTARGSVAMLGGYCLGQSLCLPSISVQGQSSMELQ